MAAIEELELMDSYFSQKHATLFILFCINYYICRSINKTDYINFCL